uniref:Uncharacterized protein n=1 Tax=Populus trichocarpa TaxID=3694 RepID=A0A3N7FM22_POPTR
MTWSNLNLRCCPCFLNLCVWTTLRCWLPVMYNVGVKDVLHFYWW